MNATEACIAANNARIDAKTEKLNNLSNVIEREARLGKDMVFTNISSNVEANMIREWCKNNITETHSYIFNMAGNFTARISWKKSNPNDSDNELAHVL